MSIFFFVSSWSPDPWCRKNDTESDALVVSAKSTSPSSDPPSCGHSISTGWYWASPFGNFARISQRPVSRASRHAIPPVSPSASPRITATPPRTLIASGVRRPSPSWPSPSYSPHLVPSAPVNSSRSTSFQPCRRAACTPSSTTGTALGAALNGATARGAADADGAADVAGAAVASGVGAAAAGGGGAGGGAAGGGGARG